MAANAAIPAGKDEMHEGFKFPINVQEAESSLSLEDRFLNRFPEATSAIKRAMDTSIAPEEFIAVIDGFNQGQPELDTAYSKDFLRLQNGREIKLFWDDQNNVRLGYSLEAEQYNPEAR